MIRVALRGLAGRKFRASLTALAVVLGVAMVSGTFVLTDTIDKAFDAIFSESYANTDAAISGKAPDISFEGSTAEAPSVPASLLDDVRELDSVEAATGSVARRDGDEDPQAGREGDQHPGCAFVRVRHRPRAVAVQPAQAGRRDLAERAGRGRDRRGDRGRAGLRTGRLGQDRDAEARAGLPDLRHCAVRKRQLARHGHVRRLHDPDRPAAPGS